MPTPSLALVQRRQWQALRNSTKKVRLLTCVPTRLIYRAKRLQQRLITSRVPLAKHIRRFGHSKQNHQVPKRPTKRFVQPICASSAAVVMSTIKSSTTSFATAPSPAKWHPLSSRRPQSQLQSARATRHSKPKVKLLSSTAS
ncbi:hypothetical protein D3C87_1801490 [compost metagenome]